MSCPDYEDRLNDYAGGYLSGREKQEVDEHLLVCIACRDEVREIRTLLDEISTLPRSIDPPGEVWEGASRGIRARLAAAGPSGSPVPTGKLAGWSFTQLAVAAAVLIVGAAALAVALLQMEGAGTGGQTPRVAEAPAGSTAVAPAAYTAVPDLAATESDFNRASEDLLAALEAQQDRIPPETLVVIEESLAAINQAIADTRAAMESEPDNARLGRVMRAMYLTKMRVLQGAVMTPAG
jgi:anti-sigma factor RsiW